MFNCLKVLFKKIIFTSAHNSSNENAPKSDNNFFKFNHTTRLIFYHFFVTYKDIYQIKSMIFLA